MTTQQIGDAEVVWSRSGIEAEYAALRGDAAAFDLGCVGVIEIRGSDRTEFVQSVAARDIGFLFPEASMASLVLDEEARPVDIVVVYTTDDTIRLETSFGRRESTLAHLTKHAQGDVTIDDITGSLGVIGIEGPYAWRAVDGLLGAGTSSISYQAVLPVDWDGGEVVLSRTGYTSEYGYKLFAPRERFDDLWAAVTAETAAIGFEALETAMVEVRQPLLHRETDQGRSVFEVGMQWLVDPQKEGYVGHAALMQEWEQGTPRGTIGVLLPDATELAPDADVIVDGDAIGHVVHAVRSPGLGRTIALASVERAWMASGLDVAVATPTGTADGRTASSPYVIPQSWSIPIA